MGNPGEDRNIWPTSLRSGRVGSTEGERGRETRTEMHVSFFPVVTPGDGRRQLGTTVTGLQVLLLASQEETEKVLSPSRKTLVP